MPYGKEKESDCKNNVLSQIRIGNSNALSTGAITASLLLFNPVSAAFAQDTGYRRLPVAEYVDKMKAGWIGQMVGVGWGCTTRFVIFTFIIYPSRTVLGPFS